MTAFVLQGHNDMTQSVSRLIQVQNQSLLLRRALVR